MALVAFIISTVTLAALIVLIVAHHQISKYSIDSEENTKNLKKVVDKSINTLYTDNS
jgi:predicted small secreted protein